MFVHVSVLVILPLFGGYLDIVLTFPAGIFSAKNKILAQPFPRAVTEAIARRGARTGGR
jgi:hypothetical protein